MKTFFYGALVILLLSLAGCASPGQESFLRGMALEKSNRLDDAATLYETAVAENPGNREYGEALARVRSGLVSRYLEAAGKSLEAKPFTFEQGRSARGMVDKALKLDATDPKAAALSAEVAARIELLTKEADSLFAASSRAAASNDWPVALAKLQEIKGFYPNHADLPEKLLSTETAAVSWYLQEAQRAKGRDDLDTAAESLRRAAVVQPENRQIGVMLADLSRLNSPAGYLTRAEDAVKKGEHGSAVALARRGVLLAKDPEAAVALQKVIDGATAVSFETAAAALKEKKLYDSYTHLADAKSFNPAALEVQKSSEVTEALAAAMVEKATAYESAGNLGNALVWFEKGQTLKPESPEIGAHIAALRDKIKQRVVKKIAVMDFLPPRNNSDAGRIVTDALLSIMTRSVSGDIKILARDVLGALLKEIELGQAGLYDIEGAKKAGKLKGTDVFIFGNVLIYDIEKEQEEGVKRVNAVVGKKAIPNPAFEIWAKSNAYPNEQKLREAPPQLVDDEIRQIISYKVATHKKTANVSISFRVIDVENGEVVITKTLKRNKEAVDTYQEGVEFANIPYKALQLPSDTELLGRVVDNIIEDLSHEVLSRFHNLQLTYYNQAEKLRNAKAYEKAVEYYVDAILVEEVKNISTQVTADSRREIEQVLRTAAL
ncbi:CsgG/HfaB family protein [Geomonas sp. RF6]|uniref:CsgG/HfaB family protein n=1 Tax=Geomonas sp. RF6 TaxID=2897342 RepID=UPI001E5CCC23|nr:CsgG/HfaB family protein [Geomonas sp. RF6]UFS70735.1 CsgG/HfaB family protein [Geomonas sp. RF6]